MASWFLLYRHSRVSISVSHHSYLRNLGYWPTMYMMFDAMIALLSFPFFCSHNPSKSWKIEFVWFVLRKFIDAHLDDCHQKPLLILLIHRPRNWSYCPTKCVKILPWPFFPIHLKKNDSEHFHDDFKTYFIGTVSTHGTCVKCYTKLDLDHLGFIFKIFNM